MFAPLKGEGSISAKNFRGVAQLASVRALGAWGPGFESRLPDQEVSSSPWDENEFLSCSNFFNYRKG